MIEGSYPRPSSLGALEPGTHLCAFHHDDRQLARIASTFIRHGLAAGDQLLYVAADDQVADVLGALPADVGTARESGQLLLASFEAAYGSRRPDDLGAIAEGFRAAARRSQKEGYAGLRVAAQMDPLVGLLGGFDEVLGWEHASTALQREIRVSSVCLYGRRHLEQQHSDLLQREHAGLAPEMATDPLASFLTVEEPWGLRISGEVDLSNVDLLHRAVLSRVRVDPRVHLDLEGLTFTDVGTLARLRFLAATLPDDGWIELDRVPDRVRRLLAISGIQHERLRVQP